VGLRCTAARLTVLQHIVDNAGPKTHAEVSDALADKGFDRATIYRNLTELTEAGILSRVELGDHVWRFELRGKDAAGRHEESHPHFVCTSCGEVSCLDDVTVAITPKSGGKATQAVARGKKQGSRSSGAAAEKRSRKSVSEIPRVTEVLLKGRCGNCAQT
jgi:Fur family ferric uptake transcriptional regulator